MPTILVVDDEPGIRESLVYSLCRDGFECMQADTLHEASKKWEKADLIILDLMLPDGSGIDFLTNLRGQSQIPVIVLTSRDEVTDRVVGLEVGADDYVVKPFSPREIVARVRAVLRRFIFQANGHGDNNSDDSESVATHDAKQPSNKVVEIMYKPALLRLDPSTRRAWCGDNELQLSKIEFELLMVFLMTPGRVFERGHLLRRVWGPGCMVGERTVDVHVKSLRKKIEQANGDSEVLETVRGVGYRLREEDV